MTSVGLDLGGTKISAALFDENGEALYKTKTELNEASGHEAGAKITSLVKEVLQEASRLNHQPNGIGICVPGIAHRSGEVWAPNIKGWENYPLKKEVESHFKTEFPVFIESDRACHIMAEVWKGAASTCHDAIFLAVGTGIGAGILADGHILRGAHDISGAIGWMALKPTYQPQYKERGCFESHASGFGIAECAKQLLREGHESIMHSRRDHLLAADVFEAYDQKDAVACKVLDDTIQFLGMASANLVSIFNPEKIIFGGGVFGPAVKFIDQIYSEALRWGQPISMKQVKFESSQLSGDAGLIGAGYLALKNGKL
jgi:glucokinase